MKPSPTRLLAALLMAAAGAAAAQSAGDAGKAQDLRDLPDPQPSLSAPEEVLGPPRVVIDLPQMGEPADLEMSPAQEQALGKRVVSELYAYNYILDDAEVDEYISQMGWRLVSASQTKPPHIDFFPIADDRINAFALPGGYIGVNAGILLSAGNESEMAGVLGHELAHVTGRHIARSQEGEQAKNIATWAAVIAAILAGSGDPDMIIGALSLGQSITYQRQVNYTRAHELEADRIGIQTMAAAGFNPQGMPSFFQRLSQESRLYGNGLPEILRTHPLSTTRVAEAQSRAASLPKSTYKDAPDFAIMQARTRVFAADNPSEAVEYFAAQMNAKATPAVRYGYAFALSERGQYEDAEAALKPALDEMPRQVNMLLLQGRLEAGLHHQDAAVAIFDKALKQYPRYAPAIFAYADALIAAGKPEQARQVLITHDQALGTRLQTYNLLSQAAREMGNTAEASYQNAMYLYLRGDAGGALASLDAGLRTAALTPQDRARLTAKRQEIRESLPKNWRAPRV